MLLRMATQSRVFQASLQLLCCLLLHIWLYSIGGLIHLYFLNVLYSITQVYTLLEIFKPVVEPPKFDTLRAVTMFDGTYLYGRYSGGEERCVFICRVMLDEDGIERDCDSPDVALDEHSSKKEYERKPVKAPTKFDTLRTMTLCDGTYLFTEHIGRKEFYVCACRVMLDRETMST